LQQRTKSSSAAKAKHLAWADSPEIDFAVFVACNRGIAAWKTRQTVKALIRTFAPKQP